MGLHDHDLDLKMRVSSLFRRLGYIVFNEVDLCVYSYEDKYSRKQITDFDVLGVLVEADFGVWIAVAECKNVKERAMESLLKLNGLKHYFSANKVYFVQKKMDANTREVGSSLGIWCLDDGNLASLMQSLNVDENSDVELERKVYSARCLLLESQKKDLIPQTTYLRYDYWTLPPNRNIVNLMRLLKEMSEKTDEKNNAHVALVHQLTTQLTLSIVRLTGELIRQNICNFPDGLLTGFLGGSRERRDREALYDTVTKIVPDASLSLQPEYFEALAELVNRYKSAAAYSHRVVSCLDDMTRRILVPECENLEALVEKYGHRTVKLARDAMHFVVKNGGISDKVFAGSLGKEEQVKLGQPPING